MRKKLLTLLLATTMAVMSLTGCGAQGEMQNAVNQAQEAKESLQAEEASIQAAIASAEQEASAQAEALANAEATASTEQTAGTETTASTEAAASTEQATVGGDWATAYEGYFEREDILPEKVKATTTATAEGVTMNMVVAMADGNLQMTIDMGAAVMDMYVMDEKVYCYTQMQGEESWTYAVPASEEEVDTVTSMQEDPTINSEDVTECSYIAEVEEDGVIYDTLKVVTANDDGTTNEMVAYVNRETQMLTKYEMEQDGTIGTCYFEEIEGIELPAEAANATEGTMEDIAMTMFAVIMMGAMGAQQ